MGIAGAYVVARRQRCATTSPPPRALSAPRKPHARDPSQFSDRLLITDGNRSSGKQYFDWRIFQRLNSTLQSGNLRFQALKPGFHGIQPLLFLLLNRDLAGKVRGEAGYDKNHRRNEAYVPVHYLPPHIVIVTLGQLYAGSRFEVPNNRLPGRSPSRAFARVSDSPFRPNNTMFLPPFCEGQALAAQPRMAARSF